MLSINDISIRLAGRLLIDDSSAQIVPGARVRFVADAVQVVVERDNRRVLQAVAPRAGACTQAPVRGAVG